MAIGISTSARNAACDAVVDLLDAGAAAGTLKVYTGSKPATPATAPPGTLLCTFTLPDPAFGSASAGVATLGTVADATVAATGTAGWFRAADSGGNAVFDGTVGTSGADLNLNSTSLTAGGTASITSGTITMPAGG